MTTKITIANESEADTHVVVVQCINPFNDGIIPTYAPKVLRAGEKMEVNIHQGIGVIVKETQVKR